MKKLLVLLLFTELVTHYTQAQTKVFKEVSEGISSQVKTIRQDNALVGYLVFTRLEKANVDSFNYRITIMDENLNNIGKVEFKEIGLTLENVSFDQDVLCLGYLKSNFLAQEYKSKTKYRKAIPNAKNSVLMQFISLSGKIIKANSIPVNINMDKRFNQAFGSVYSNANLKYPVLVKNISQQRF